MTAPAIDAQALAECCGSRHWQAQMVAGLPYRSVADLLAASEQAFDALSREDWMEAFGAHSTIGATRPGDWTGAREQVGIDAAGGDVRTALAAGNIEYRARFGFVFLIRAKGRGAGEILGQLRERLENPLETEIANACAEQREIAALRLEDLAVASAGGDIRLDAGAPDAAS